MTPHRLFPALLLATLAGVAQAQHAADAAGGPARVTLGLASTPCSKPAAPPPAGPGGGGLLTPGQGSDSAATPDAISGQGLFPWDTQGATTGPEGQDESLCNWSAYTGIEEDVWFRWTADASGVATVTTVGLTTHDTKLAAWPDAPGGVVPGSVLACNDDDFGSGFLQSTVRFHVASGESYILQLGGYPGGGPVGGGTGDMDIRVDPPPACGIMDGGVSDNSMTLVIEADFLWMNRVPCLCRCESVAVVFGGLLVGPGHVPNGTPYEVHLWDDLDSDGDPENAVHIGEVTGLTVQNSGTDIFNPVVLPTPVDSYGELWVGVLLHVLPPTGNPDYVAPEDHTYYDLFPGHSRWYAEPATGSPGFILDVDDLESVTYTDANDTPWMIRAYGSETCALGTRFCFGDGSDGVTCPCGNAAAPGSPDGCVNSTGLGAYLEGRGAPLVGADTLELRVRQARPNDIGIYVQNVTTGAPFPFYDGAVCLSANSHLVRHYDPPAVVPTITDNTGTGVNAQPLTLGDFLGDTQPGVTVHYQFWGRDTSGPCSTGAQFSSGLSILWR